MSALPWPFGPMTGLEVAYRVVGAAEGVEVIDQLGRAKSWAVASWIEGSDPRWFELATALTGAVFALEEGRGRATGARVPYAWSGAPVLVGLVEHEARIGRLHEPREWEDMEPELCTCDDSECGVFLGAWHYADDPPYSIRDVWSCTCGAREHVGIYYFGEPHGPAWPATGAT